MKRAAYFAIEKAVTVLAQPVVTSFFLRGDVGREYGVGLSDKRRLMRKIRRNTTEITGATSYYEHLLLATYLLSTPKSVRGDIAECGCFKGRSTATLSLVGELVGRRVRVFDSFQGLPEIDNDDKVHISLHSTRYEVYEKGDYTGTIDEVRRNVERYGQADRCEFIEGYFEDSLPSDQGEYAFIFLDVDLNQSLKSCLMYLWPRLSENGYLFTHEAQQLPFAKVFFDESWWQDTLACEAPGLVGSGIGLPAGMSRGSGLGYARKLSATQPVTENPIFERFCGDPTQK